MRATHIRPGGGRMAVEKGGARPRSTARIIAPHPALMLEGDRRHLVIADLHIGFESGLAANDVHVDPSATVDEAIGEVGEMVRGERPDSLVLLGDVRSGIRSISEGEWDGIPRFLEEAHRMVGSVMLVPGNHDSNIGRLVPGDTVVTSPAGVILDGTLLTHGHAMPSDNMAGVDRIVMGHLHPVFFSRGSLLNGERVWVSIRTEKSAVFPSRSGMLEITVMPSFNRYFYAAHRGGGSSGSGRRRSISPIMERIVGAWRGGQFRVSARIATLDGAVIGDESALGCVV